MIGAAFFEQERKRTGGLVDIEFRPSDDLRIDAQYFQSDLDATNYNRNYLLWNERIVDFGNGQAPDPGYVVRNNTLVAANFSPQSGCDVDAVDDDIPDCTLYGVYDQISRPDEKASSNYGSLEASYRFSDAFTLSGQVGTSKGHGETPTQDVSETHPRRNSGGGFQLNGLGNAPDFNFGTADTSTPSPGGTPPVVFGWIFGAQFVDVEDEENWAKVDADFAIDSGAWTDLKFGVRVSEHKRDSLGAVAQGPFALAMDPANYPTTFQSYPSDFNTFGGSFPTNIWFWSPSQLAEYNGEGFVNRDLVERAYYQNLFEVEEKNAAAYVQADFRGSNWSGNIGVRVVRTEEDIVTYTQTSATDPDAIPGSLFGPFKGINVDNTYDDVLPSANLKWDVTEDLVARFAAAMTMTRPDYSALAGFTDLSPPANVGGTGTGTGGNPDLEPIRSTNFDAGLEWYFAKNSLLGVGLFYMDLENYVSFGSETKTYFTFSEAFPDGADVPYVLTVPVNAEGRVQGVELSYQQAIGENFGVAANYTYADGKQTSLVTTGDDRLVGTSENTYNLSGYFENDRFNARVTYTYRSEFFSGLDRNTAFSQDEISSLAASLGFIFNENLSVVLDGQNLTNETLKYFALNEDQPRAFYKNGAQYYLNLRVKF
jgi:iron complex outermembrane receptor protein